jgi:hypothetical protein
MMRQFMLNSRVANQCRKGRRWHDRTTEVADGKWNKKPCAFDQDAVLMAGRASVAMDAIERRKAG